MIKKKHLKENKGEMGLTYEQVQEWVMLFAMDLFNRFMNGQTYAVGKHGEGRYYYWDVEKFVRGLQWRGRIMD